MGQNLDLQSKLGYDVTLTLLLAYAGFSGDQTAEYFQLCTSTASERIMRLTQSLEVGVCLSPSTDFSSPEIAMWSHSLHMVSE